MVPRASVIVATYNQPKSLRLVLAGLAAQTVRDFEVIVADDGSGRETAEVCRAAGVRHVWQENRGFRKAKIVNEAVRQSKGEALIFIDGDCIPRLDHVERHLKVLGPRKFAVGGYVDVKEPDARALTPESVAAGAHHPLIPASERARLMARHVQAKFYIAVRKRNRPKTYGANLSVGREVFYEVNGFDENYDGAGQEESDLRNRLILAGARPVSLWSSCWVFHLRGWLDPRTGDASPPRRKNREYYRRKLTSPRCDRGLVSDQR